MDAKARPAPAAGQLVHEDFEPQYQWTSGKDTDTVTVDLTAFKGEAEFKKEHLKVKIDNHGNLKVSGERPLGGGNRWRRFQKVFRMAEDCITSDIKAKFDNGVLSVVMPKLAKDQHTSTPQPPPAVAASALPPAKPEPTAASTKAQVVEPAEDGKKETAGDEEAEPAAAEKPSPPAADVGSPTCGPGPRRRLRRVIGVVAVAAVVAAAVGLGFYCWSHWHEIGPDEQLDLTDALIGEY